MSLETGKLIADKENILSPMEIETGPQMCIYLQAGNWAFALKVYVKRNTRPPEWLNIPEGSLHITVKTIKT